MAALNRAPQPRRRRRPKARPKVRPGPTKGRRRPEQRLVGQPSVLVFGVSDLSERVKRSIRKKGIRCERVERAEEAFASIGEETKAVFVVPPIPKVSVVAYVARVRQGEHTPPVFVVLEGTLPARSLRDLYREGVAAVFELPLDSEALERTVFRVAGSLNLIPRPRKRASEIALEEVVRSRLDAHATHFGTKLRIEVHRRFVVFHGSVDSLWKLELALRIASETPGVKEVLGDTVEIEGESRSDRAIAGAVRAVLNHASTVDTSTLAVAVRHGVVTLTGTANDRREMTRARNLISQVRGVRKVDNYVTVSSEKKKQDRTIAVKVLAALRSSFPKAKVTVAVFGGVAVLSGRVPRASTRLEVLDIVANQDGVARVVDKMTVV